MLKNCLCILFFSLLFIKCLIANENEYVEPKAAFSSDFRAGYLKSKIEDFFPHVEIELAIQNNEIIIYRYPADNAICEQLVDFLERQPGNLSIRFDRSYQYAFVESINIPIEKEIEEGNWLPELTPFFPTMLADPRLIAYSAGYRTYDKVFKIALLPVSMGDRFSLYQFKSLGHWRLYLGIEAGVWAVFEAKTKSLALINADYYIGIPVTYIRKGFSARLRIYHQSSHLGDELLIENESICRLNPSMEAVDLFASYEMTNNWTVFGGVGRIIRSDDSYHIKPYYFVYGSNYFINQFNIQLCNLEATPYIGVYFSNWQDNKWKLNSSIAIGYQWDKLYGHKFRISLEAHDGHSFEGQFSKQRTRYFALRMIYGY